MFISFLKLTLTQVQLLVSNSDVENYKQIKSDLDELRLLVEKSELWVYKSKKDLPTETRVRKITPGLVGLRKPDGGSSKETESPRKDSLEQEGVAVNTSQDPQSSDSESGSTKVGHTRSVSKVPLVTVFVVIVTFGSIKAVCLDHSSGGGVVVSASDVRSDHVVHGDSLDGIFIYNAFV